MRNRLYSPAPNLASARSLNYIASQWTVRLSRLSEDGQVLFKGVASVLKAVLPDLSYQRLIGNSRDVDDSGWTDKIPTLKLSTVVDELRAVIAENLDDSEHRFGWRMIGDHLQACQVYISATEVMIRPLIPPTWTHAPFANATQRIFMSATLGAGGDLERLTGRPKIMRLPIPEGWDRQGIGRRFFMFPEKSLKEDECLQLRRDLMEMAGRSLVLTSNEIADEISKDVDSQLHYPVFSASDLESGKSQFTKAEKAVAVIANRYDGIDFPDDDCRLMFIEGLPRAMNLQERFLMSRMGANLLFNERIQTRVFQAVGRCTRGLNDYSAVVVTGQDLPAYLTDQKRRGYFHPELQAEIKFGIDQSTKVDADTFRENLAIFLEHDAAWEEANDNILEARATATQAEFPAMNELSEIVQHEINWQKALWNEDFFAAYEAAREVLGGLNDTGLRGYRALWHYLAGSAAELAAEAGDKALESQARSQYQKAKQAASGIPWLVALARGQGTLSTSDEQQAAVMLQVERLEGHLLRLGTLHNRSFSAYEKEIREGLQGAEKFERAQVALGEHLGFKAGKRETDASPDPWWMSGNIVIVFEDHANANPKTSIVDATKARQAASHPDWIRESVAGTADASIYPVLVTPSTKMAEGAIPHLRKVFHWDLDEFRAWSDLALDAVRELRRSFVEPGDLSWRAQAAEALARSKADAPGLAAWLTTRPATAHLKRTP